MSVEVVPQPIHPQNDYKIAEEELQDRVLQIYGNNETDIDLFRPMLADNQKIGFFTLDRGSQTNATEIVDLKEMTEVIQVLIQDVSTIRRDLNLNKHVMQADYEGNLQRKSLELYCRINERVTDLEKLHEKRIIKLRHAFKQQLSDAIARISYLFDKNLQARLEEEREKLAGYSSKNEERFQELQTTLIRNESVIKMLQTQLNQYRIKEAESQLADRSSITDKTRDDAVSVQSGTSHSSSDHVGELGSSTVGSKDEMEMERHVSRLEESIHNKEMEVSQLNQQIDFLQTQLKRCQKLVDQLHQDKFDIKQSKVEGSQAAKQLLEQQKKEWQKIMEIKIQQVKEEAYHKALHSFQAKKPKKLETKRTKDIIVMKDFKDTSSREGSNSSRESSVKGERTVYSKDKEAVRGKRHYSAKDKTDSLSDKDVPRERKDSFGDKEVYREMRSSTGDRKDSLDDKETSRQRKDSHGDRETTTERKDSLGDRETTRERKDDSLGDRDVSKEKRVSSGQGRLLGTGDTSVKRAREEPKVGDKEAVSAVSAGSGAQAFSAAAVTDVSGSTINTMSTIDATIKASSIGSEMEQTSSVIRTVAGAEQREVYVSKTSVVSDYHESEKVIALKQQIIHLKELLEKEKAKHVDKHGENLVDKHIEKPKEDVVVSKVLMREDQLAKEVTRLKKETERINRTWEKKFAVLQRSLFALKDESYLRQTLQKQAAQLHHAAVSYAADKPMEIKPVKPSVITKKPLPDIPNAVVKSGRGPGLPGGGDKDYISYTVSIPSGRGSAAFSVDENQILSDNEAELPVSVAPLPSPPVRNQGNGDEGGSQPSTNARVIVVPSAETS